VTPYGTHDSAPRTRMSRVRGALSYVRAVDRPVEAMAWPHHTPCSRPPTQGAVCCCVQRRGQACGAAALIAEMSKVSLTLSLTMTPPVSSAAFQVRPQSERRMSALPSKPTRSLP